jgi:hypothetical protein
MELPDKMERNLLKQWKKLFLLMSDGQLPDVRIICKQLQMYMITKYKMLNLLQDTPIVIFKFLSKILWFDKKR